MARHARVGGSDWVIDIGPGAAKKATDRRSAIVDRGGALREEPNGAGSGAVPPIMADMQADELLAEAATLPTLDHVFRWALAQEPRVLPADVVIQDEYTHDVLFRAPDGSVLVFDAT